jgi:hypothetical protein
MELRDEDRNWGLGTYLKNIDNLLSIGFQMPLTLYRHSGMILAGIHHKQRPKTWIPACHAVAPPKAG